MLLIVPSENGIDKNKLPWLTFTLILLNIFAFAFLQTGDNEKFDDAYSYYIENDLLEKEMPVFLDYIETRDPELHQDIELGNIPDISLVQTILYDKRFAQYLKNNDFIDEEIQKKRRPVNEYLEKTSIYRFAFYTSSPDIFTAFTHMFMHGGIQHLIGNMIFLFIFGYNIEKLLGIKKTAALYLVSGLSAVAVFALTSTKGFSSLVGASGAIAGLMGAFAGYYGFKKVRFFYWIVFFFNQIRLPAVIVLVIWLMKELLLSRVTEDNVAYMAHFGGLVAGAICAYLFRVFLNNSSEEDVDNDDIIGLSLNNQQGSTLSNGTIPNNAGFESHDLSSSPVDSVDYQRQARLLEKAKAAIKELDFDLAKDYYQQLLIAEPNNANYIGSLYNLEKDSPKSAMYKDLAFETLEKSLHNEALLKLQTTILSDISYHYQGYHIIPKELLMSVAAQNLALNNIKPIAPIVQHLSKSYPESKSMPNLLYKYAIAEGESGDRTSQYRWFNYLIKHYPSSKASDEAHKALRSHNELL